ncbi:LOW QUALITY PROTEIN: F-actin-monooxygenase mical1 [Esox lucius]|uniref:LOW QUALITY PROTEIN: F-actin-monooxygenase mical1 n=1 Tax=Esox lucius TaxID=8010 RepID=UPI0014768FB6|nr:LOW QUALITY PROTEIN: F-actin-monooxygenase mical1 [Esox lucius]
MANQDPANRSHALFDQFVQAQTCKEVQRTFSELCQHLQVDPRQYQSFYTKLKESLNYWKAKALWVKLDKRAQHQDYQQGKICARNKCLVLGAGPCGLRTAIELALLGAQVVVLEKRDSFARNNVLHLWPYTICDLRGLAAKMFYGRFCTGALDHVSIRQLQLILLKVALLLGVEVHTRVEFKGFVEPTGTTGWMATVLPDNHPAGKFQFDVFISAGGGRYVPDGFRRKELRGKLAIGITCNFINRHTAEEAQVAEISGVARIYNQKFFKDLQTETGIDLENIVYYKDDTHYFVMTAKKKSLLMMGVIKKDFADADQLLAQANVDHEALLRYAHGAAHFSTGRRLPNMTFANNHAGQPDVAMFDFTCMHRSENASLVRERRGKKLLIGLVGDCLVEPFWPLGTGIARGFLAAFDAAWMVRSWGKGKAPLEVLAERESIYQLLSQTTPENISKNYSAFSIDPATRYQHINLKSIKTNQVQQLYDVEDHLDSGRPTKKQKNRLSHLRQDSAGAFQELLTWCQQNTAGYDRVNVTDLNQSWASGLALCALIHTFRPHLIDMSSLNESDAVYNNQLAFSILERELGIPPIMSASEMASKGQIDQLSVVLYLTQVQRGFSERTPTEEPQGPQLTPSKSLSFQSAVLFLNKLKHNSLQRRKEKLAARKEEKEGVRMGDEEEPVAPLSTTEVTSNPEAHLGPKLSPTSGISGTEECYFCGQRVYVLERISTEGKFFHRSCFTCQQCGTTLRLGGYTFSQETGRFYCELHSEQLELENRKESTSVQDFGDHTENKRGVNGISCEEHSPCHSEEEEEEDDDDDDGQYYLDSGPPKSTDPLRQDDRSSKQSDHVEEPSVQPLSPTDDLTAKGLQVCVKEEERVEDSPSDPPIPVPKPRRSRSSSPQVSPPVPKPRTVVLTPKKETTPAEVVQAQTPSTGDKSAPTADPDSRPKQSLRKLKLTNEEKNQLVNLSFSLDSDSETPVSSSCSSSSATVAGPSPPKPLDGLEEEGYWSGGPGPAGHIREHRNRRCFRRKDGPGAPQGQHARVRSKFSPWNLSSPRLGRDHRFSILSSHPEIHYEHSVSEEDGADGDDDDDDDDEDEDELDMLGVDDLDLFNSKFQDIPSDPVEAEKMELLKMRTLERRAKTCEMQRFHRAQSIQRRLEEIEVTFKELEDKGVVLEQVLRGEEGSSGSPEMIDQWIHLVHQKNALVSEESDLMVASRQLELEDKQSMLEMELRQYMELNDSEKTPEQQAEEERVLQEMLEVVDMRDSLVAFLEEKRLKEMESDEQQATSLLEAKRHSTASAGAQVHWA